MSNNCDIDCGHNNSSSVEREDDEQCVDKCGGVSENHDLEWDSQDMESTFMRAEKRKNSGSVELEEDDDERGFISVVRRRPKRLARSYSHIQNKEPKQHNSEETFEICMTSKSVLPKPIGMAKLLRSENIENIQRIKYKNSYKVLIMFQSREDAEKLIKCEKIQELGYRCQYTFETNVSYGIVKQIELDITKEELQKSFKCNECDIISIIRLKRMSDEGWTESETVRFCFKSPTLPPYVYAYGCRFKVEQYTFPVTQCSNCWKYGHSHFKCPLKTTICPKCGGKHSNCEVTSYTCVNCKGDHMALYKGCPVFLKEKEIRSIMTQQNCSYRRALEILKEENRKEPSNTAIHSSVENTYSIQQQNTKRTTYRDIVLTRAEVHNTVVDKQGPIAAECHKTPPPISSSPILNKGKKKPKKKSMRMETNLDSSVEDISLDNLKHYEEIETEKKNNSKEKSRRRNVFSFKRLMDQIKEILLAELSLEEKIKSCFNVLIIECSSFFFNFMRDTDMLNSVIGYFTNG